MRLVREEFTRFKRAFLPVTAVLAAVGFAQTVEGLRLSSEEWAWLIVATLVVVLVYMRYGERAAAIQHERDLVVAKAEQISTLAGLEAKITHRDAQHMAELDRLRDTKVTRARNNRMSRLRNEYLASHDGISPAMLAGNEPLPAGWVRERVRHYGWTDVFPEYAD